MKVLKVLGSDEPCCPQCGHNNAMLHHYEEGAREVRRCRDCGYVVPERHVIYRQMEWDKTTRSWRDETPKVQTVITPCLKELERALEVVYSHIFLLKGPGVAEVSVTMTSVDEKERTIDTVVSAELCEQADGSFELEEVVFRELHEGHIVNSTTLED